MASHANGTFASPLANAAFISVIDEGWLSKLYNNFNGLRAFAMFLLILVVYDQCGSRPSKACHCGRS